VTAVPALTVVVPTFQGSHRVTPLLRALARQSLDRRQYEVVIVDNGSRDDSARRIERSLEFAAVAAGGAARVMTLDTPGLTNARIQGVLAARAPIVLFLDDDGEPEGRCCETVVESFEEPRVGVVFGRVYPKYVAPPSHAIRKREGLLAINHQLGDAPLIWKAAGEFAPTLGVALAVRRTAFLESYPWREPHRLLADRVGTRPVSGGDMEIGHFLGLAGWWRVYNPQLVVRHAIEPRRLDLAAFSRLIVGIERSRATFEDKFALGPRPMARRLRAGLDAAAIVALAPLWIASRDGYAGWQFALASRAGRFLGRYRGAITPSGSSSTTSAGPRTGTASP
jgi:glycosyltransferase involved in cell wall biosynthesis